MRPSAPLLSAAARAAAPVMMTTSPAPSISVPTAQQKARYKVGCVDFELDHLIDDGGVAPLSSSGAAAASSSTIDHSRHLVGSIYYPAAAVSATKAHRWSPTLHQTLSYVSFASRASPDHGTALRKAKTAAFAAVSHGVLLAAVVRVAADAGRAAPPLKKKKKKREEDREKEEENSDDGPPFPPVVFLHGLGGSRAAYSAFAASLASAGFAVLAIEHADGTAAVAKLAGSRGWRDYERWQPGGEQLRARGEARRAELAAAARVWRALALAKGSGREAEEGKGTEGGGGGGGLGGGETLRGLSLEGGKVPLEGGKVDFFVGAVDAEVAPAVVGHSFGGALAADAAGEADLFSAAVCLDPWWGAVPPDSKAGDLRPSSSSSVSKAPLFVLGSDAWNTPNAEGEIACGKEAQERVLESFSSSCSSSYPSPSASKSSKNESNSGALFAILKGSSHAGFSDVVSLLPGLSKWFYGRRRKQAAAGGEGVEEDEEASRFVTEAIDPVSTAKAAAEMTAAFLRRHAGKRERGRGDKVTGGDREAVLEAARSVGVELRGLRVV